MFIRLFLFTGGTRGEQHGTATLRDPTTRPSVSLACSTPAMLATCVLLRCIPCHQCYVAFKGEIQSRYN